VRLPVARIKKIMKSDQDVRMISIEAPILFSKACELFIMELSHKAMFYARRDGRKQV
jgi:nuclear transcription factor Y gamma